MTLADKQSQDGPDARARRSEQAVWAALGAVGAVTLVHFLTWEQIGYPSHLSAAVRDLWAHKDLGKFTGKCRFQNRHKCQR